MFINSITISAFGKLKNCNFEFKNGINLLCGPNEAGKTTLLEFIKFIFYRGVYNVYTRRIYI